MKLEIVKPVLPIRGLKWIRVRTQQIEFSRAAARLLHLPEWKGFGVCRDAETGNLYAFSLPESDKNCGMLEAETRSGGLTVCVGTFESFEKGEEYFVSSSPVKSELNGRGLNLYLLTPNSK